MKYVVLPDEVVRPLPFYLAMEEYMARNFSDDLFFMWQVEPTVIFGRNQVIHNEVNIDYCREHNIAMFRRKSGGGCVYADMDNIMFSYIVNSDSVVTTFTDYTSKVASMLQSLGMDAAASGRNDILINGRKVSGNAFYHIPGRSIVHGTMLYSTDIEAMVNAISPSRTKLESKGVESVRSHVTTISEHSDISLDDFKAYARRKLCDGEILLDRDDIAAIEEIAHDYYREEWIYGKNPSCTHRASRRIEGVGEFHVQLVTVRDCIGSVNLTGDFFCLGDLDRDMLDRFKGIRYERGALEKAVDGIDCGSVIAGLTNRQLINLIYNDYE